MTLIFACPVSHGWLAAADSRGTVAGRFIDNRRKLRMSTKSPGTLTLATGLTEMMHRPPGMTDDDVEANIHLLPRQFDVLDAAQRYLDENIVGDDFNPMAAALVTHVGDYVGRHPGAIPPGHFCNVTVLDLTPSGRRAVTMSLVVTDSRDVQCIRIDTSVVGDAMPVRFMAWGATEYFNDVVCRGGYLSQKAIDFILDVTTPASQVDADEAADIADELLAATTRASAVIPPPHGVGGPTRFAILDANGARPFQRGEKSQPGDLV